MAVEILVFGPGKNKNLEVLNKILTKSELFEIFVHLLLRKK